MKKLLLSIVAVSALVGTTSAGAWKSFSTSNVSQGFKSNEKNKEENINQIIYETGHQYEWSYKIYLNHKTVNSWNEMRIKSNQLTFKKRVGFDLTNFKNNTWISIFGAISTASDLYNIWNENKVTTYDHGRGVIFELNYSHYTLYRAVISSQNNSIKL